MGPLQQLDACGKLTKESLNGEITPSLVCINLNTLRQSTSHHRRSPPPCETLRLLQVFFGVDLHVSARPGGMKSLCFRCVCRARQESRKTIVGVVVLLDHFVRHSST